MIHLGGAYFYGFSHVSIPKGRRLSVPKFFGTPTYTQTVWPRATKFGRVTMWRRGVLLGIQPHSPSEEAGPKRPEYFGGISYTCAHTSRETSLFCLEINFGWDGTEE